MCIRDSGTDITKLKGEELRNNRQNIQMVFQDPTLSFNPKMNIRDIVCEPLMNFKKIKKKQSIEEKLQRKEKEPLSLIHILNCLYTEPKWVVLFFIRPSVCAL